MDNLPHGDGIFRLVTIKRERADGPKIEEPTEEQKARWAKEDDARKLRKWRQERILAPIFERMDSKDKKMSGCGDGWHEILLKLNKELTIIDPDYRVLQFKEKFGTLRYYFSCKPGVAPLFSKIIQKAEKESSTVCERCGQPGSTGGTGWIRTLCEKCRNPNTEL